MEKYKIGYCAGVFDLFHVGHINLFKQAKEKCEYLIVGVLTDELAIRCKKYAPYIPFEERLQIVEACKYVDRAVMVSFDTFRKMEAWEKYHYDCFFSGNDCEGNPMWVEDKRLLNECNSDIYFFPYTKTTSSTKIRQALEAKDVKGDF